MKINKLRYYFIFCNREYVFRDKKLYQQPYNKGLRWYSEREIKMQKDGGYRLQGLFVSKSIIKTNLKQKTFNESV